MAKLFSNACSQPTQLPLLKPKEGDTHKIKIIIKLKKWAFGFKQVKRKQLVSCACDILPPQYETSASPQWPVTPIPCLWAPQLFHYPQNTTKNKPKQRLTNKWNQTKPNQKTSVSKTKSKTPINLQTMQLDSHNQSVFCCSMLSLINRGDQKSKNTDHNHTLIGI